MGFKCHADGGSYQEVDENKKFVGFTRGYFSVLDDNGKLLHFEKDIGNYHPSVCEFKALKWAVDNIKERPLIITTDCLVAIRWTEVGSKRFNLWPLNYEGVYIEYLHGNLADMWNARHLGARKRDSLFYLNWKKQRSELGKPIEIG